MKKYQLLPALLGLILLAFVSGAVGQFMQSGPSPISVGYPTTQTSQVGQTTGVSPYAQYYTVGPAPQTHITAPQQFNIEGNTPADVYFGQTKEQQPVAYSQYQSSPTSAEVNSLWIKGSDSWAQYAEVPQGAVVPLLARSPNGGSGYISETHPEGKSYSYNYFFYPNSQLTYYADTLGQHTLSFNVAGQPSNPVVIEVIGTYKPPRYYSPPSNYIPPNYYPGYNYPFVGDGFGGDGHGGGDGEHGGGDGEHGGGDGGHGGR